MAFCDACACKKPLPVNRLVPTGPCNLEDFRGCPLYREAMERLKRASQEEGATQEKERS